MLAIDKLHAFRILKSGYSLRERKPVFTDIRLFFS